MTTDEALRALLRERVRLGGVQLAKRLGISQPYLIAVINGDRKPEHVLARFAEYRAREGLDAKEGG